MSKQHTPTYLLVRSIVRWVFWGILVFGFLKFIQFIAVMTWIVQQTAE